MAKILLDGVSTNTFPVVNFGTYWGGLNYLMDDVFDADCVDIEDYDPADIGEDTYAELVSLVNEGYEGAPYFYAAVKEDAAYWIQRAFEEYGIPATVVDGSCEWSHPRSFNFRDSWMVFDMEIDAAWVEDTFISLMDDPGFKEYIDERFSSRDGFISYLPNNTEDLEEMLDPHNRDYWKVVSELVQYFVSEDPNIADSITDEMIDDLRYSGKFVTFSDLGIDR
jgi:hypothetical protein